MPPGLASLYTSRTLILVAAGFIGLFLPVFLLGMIGLNLVGMPFLNAFSRWMEIRADQFSLKLTKDPGNFISMMNKLGMQNLAEFEPHWLKELMFYDHPSLARRIRFAEASRAIG